MRQFTKEECLNLLKAIMSPKCEHCSDTCVVCGGIFDSQDPSTYWDWEFCWCEAGDRYCEEHAKEIE